LLEEPLGKSGCQYTSIWNDGRGRGYTKSSKHRLCCIRAAPQIMVALIDYPSTHLVQCVSPLLALAVLKPARKGCMGRSQLWSQRSESVACALFLNDDCVHALKEYPISYRKHLFRYLTFLNISGEGSHRRVDSDIHLQDIDHCYWITSLSVLVISYIGMPLHSSWTDITFFTLCVLCSRIHFHLQSLHLRGGGGSL
jgi:hypothetical protein